MSLVYIALSFFTSDSAHVVLTFCIFYPQIMSFSIKIPPSQCSHTYLISELKIKCNAIIYSTVNNYFLSS